MFNIFFRNLFLCLFILTISSIMVKSQIHKKHKFSDDIAEFRPMYEITDTVSDEPGYNTQLPPVQDITYYLDDFLDFIAKENGGKKYVEGYRVQVYSGEIRSEALLAKQKVYKKFPDTNVYTKYRQPNYKVRAGDFDNRLDAFRMYIALKNDISKMIVIPDKVKIKKWKK